MQYDKSKLYLAVCVSAFFLILSYTLFYSFGYKYDFDTHESYQTGAIVLKAQPKDADITKDGEAVQRSGFLNGIWSTFVKIENLETKSYDLKVSKDGYFDWGKRISISAGAVDKYESIVLLRKDYERQPVFPDVDLGKQKHFWTFPEENRVAFAGNINYLEGLFLLNLDNGEQKMVLDQVQSGLMGEVTDVRLGADDSKLIVTAGGKLFVVDMNEDNQVYPIPDSVGKVLLQGGTLFDVNGRNLAFVQDGSVWFFNYVFGQSAKALDGVDNFYLYQGNLYYYKPDAQGMSALFSLNVGDNAEQTLVATGIEGLDPKASFVIKKDWNRLLLLSAGTLWLADNEPVMRRINAGVKEAHFFQGGRRVLYFSDNEIWVYYIEPKTSQPMKAQGENELLVRFASKLANIHAYVDDEHIFFGVNGGYYFTELDGRDNRNTFNLFPYAEGKELYYSRAKNALFLVEDGKLELVDLKEGE